MGHPGQPARGDGEETEESGKHRLEERQRQPWQDTHHYAGPRQKRDVERGPEKEAVAESADELGGVAGQHPRQGREREDPQVPPAERREAQAQQ